MKNCPNCAAPYDVWLNKCPYCGTSYFDMSSIDFTSGEPIFLKIKVSNRDGYNYYITQKCIPNLASMNVRSESNYCMDARGHILKTFVSNRMCETDITFTAIPTEKDVLFNVRATQGE